MTREKIMSSLSISEEDVTSGKFVEKLYCAAILNAGVDIASKILSEYIKMRDIILENKEE